MNCRVENKHDLTVVYLEGRLNYETLDLFKEQVVQNLVGKKIIFNLESLSFVGSSGIGGLLEAMEDLTRQEASQLKLCSVGSEFKRIFAVSSISNIKIYENEETATFSFSDNQTIVTEDLKTVTYPEIIEK